MLPSCITDSRHCSEHSSLTCFVKYTDLIFSLSHLVMHIREYPDFQFCPAYSHTSYNVLIFMRIENLTFPIYLCVLCPLVKLSVYFYFFFIWLFLCVFALILMSWVIALNFVLFCATDGAKYISRIGTFNDCILDVMLTKEMFYLATSITQVQYVKHFFIHNTYQYEVF